MTSKDTRHRLLTVSTQGGGVSDSPPVIQRTHAYDLAGRAVLLVAANGQTSLNSYDALGRLKDRTLFKTSAMSESGVLAQFEWEHDLLGNVTAQHEVWPGEISRGSSIRSTVMDYDDNNRLLSETIQLRSNGSAPPVDQSLTEYSYDEANNRASKTVTRLAGTSTEAGENDVGHWAYGYNAANQLVSWEKWDEPGGSLQKSATLSYDDTGNRTSQTITGYAANSAPSALGSTLYTWDAQDRLASVTMPDGSTHAYEYDYRTRRIGTRSDGILPSGGGPTTTKHTAIVFSGGLSVAEWEQSGLSFSSISGSATVEYTRGPDMGGGVGGLLYTARSDTSGSPPSALSPTLRYNLNNGRGDIVAQADQGANLTWTASYEAYGKRTKETGTNADKQRANTKDEDPTGLLNEGFRYRDIETGVWLSRDPAGFVDGPNLYAYVLQNPWTGWDPDGLKTVADYDSDLKSAETSYNNDRAKILANTKPGSDRNRRLGALGKGYGDKRNKIVQSQTKIIESAAIIDELNKDEYGTTNPLSLDDDDALHKTFRSNYDGYQLSSAIATEIAITYATAGIGRGVTAIIKAQRASLAAKTTAGAADNVIHVTPSGVAFPPGPKYQIPKHYVENPHRTGSYGEMVNGKYVERLRIDPPTPPGMKGPNHSHYHLDGKGTHYSPRPGDKDPGFAPRTSTN